MASAVAPGRTRIDRKSGKAGDATRMPAPRFEPIVPIWGGKVLENAVLESHKAHLEPVYSAVTRPTFPLSRLSPLMEWSRPLADSRAFDRVSSKDPTNVPIEIGSEDA